jgi:hypothetical protein
MLRWNRVTAALQRWSELTQPTCCRLFACAKILADTIFAQYFSFCSKLDLALELLLARAAGIAAAVGAPQPSLFKQTRE